MANVSNKNYRDGNFVIIETTEDGIITKNSVFAYYDSYVNDKKEAEKRAYTALIIPDNVTDISNTAFNKYPNGKCCKDLKCIYVPDSVKTIQPYAFTGCINVEYIRLSPNLEWIGDNAFANLPKLWKMDIPKDTNFGCKYYNEKTGKSEYKNDRNQIMPNCPKYTSFAPWIYAASEFGYGTVIYDANPMSFLQESIDQKEWTTIPNANGKYVVKQDNIMRYYRVAEQAEKTKRNPSGIIARTKIVKVYPLL